MLLPDKHITIAESIIGLAALMLVALYEPCKFEVLTQRIDEILQREGIPVSHNANTCSLALCLLYSIGVADVTDEGVLFRCDS